MKNIGSTSENNKTHLFPKKVNCRDFPDVEKPIISYYQFFHHMLCFLLIDYSFTKFCVFFTIFHRLHGGLEPLVDLINDSENSSNKKLLAAVTGALWKVSSDSDNVERLIDLGIVPTLIRLLLENSDALDDLQFNPLKISVLTNVVGALAECAKQQDNRDLIKNEDGLAPLIKLIGKQLYLFWITHPTR